MNQTFKNSLKMSSNILLLVTLALMAVTAWTDEFYLSIATISLSVVSIVVTVLSVDKMTFSNVIKEINNYFFIVTILIALSVTLTSQILFYIGLVLFIMVIFLYFIPMFVKEKEEKKKGKGKKHKK